MARDWSGTELQEIVNDYFVMLEHEQRGLSFNKSEHRRELMGTVERTEGSIEWKHMNISAVMVALGLPHIEGYRPQTHYQGALFQAVEDYLARNGDLLKHLVGEDETIPNEPRELLASTGIVFDDSPPQVVTSQQSIPADIKRVIRRFEHPAERDARMRALGNAGESYVFKMEKRRLAYLGLRDLSDRVQWVARDKGDGFGYDISSFCGNGDDASQERLLEVKTTNGPKTTPFLITSNELDVSRQRPCYFRIVRLYSFRSRVRAYRLKPPLEDHARLAPALFMASFV